jgi:hypothetical protein
MARVRAYQCDAPGCSITNPGNPLDPPIGLRGSVAEDTGGAGIATVRWYACSRDHIDLAIQAVLDLAWEG